jgi:pimeloyl-CoA synthetase
MAKTAAAKHASDYRKRQAEQKAALGVETLKVDVPEGVKAGLKRLMKEHGFSQQQEVFQTALLYLIRASHAEAACILKPDTSGFSINSKLARRFYEASLKEMRLDLGEEIIETA